jgi:acetyl esterase/lipase
MRAAVANASSRPGSRCLSRRPEARSLDVFIRAFLSAVSLVVLVPAAFAVIGGFDSRLPIIGPFGAVLNTGLPWVFGAATAAAGLAGIVVVLGGRKARILFVAALAILIGAGFVGYRYMTFAFDHGARYDVVRSLDGFPPIEQADKTVLFATVDGTDLHAGLWLPAGSGAAPPASLPAVVFAHGGGFLAGGLGTRPQLLDSLRDAGIVGIDVEYRLAPPPRWDQAPGDVLCAMAWLRTSPELAMVDPSRVVLAGESAGGSLALLAGYAAGTDALPSSCPEVGPQVIPSGLFVTAPTASLEGIWRDATIHDLNGKIFPYSYIGGSPDQYPERYAAAEPFRLLRPDLPPTLILAGETDKLVHIERSRDLADQIRAAGVQVELLVAPFAGHGFDGEPNSFGAQLSESLVRDFVFRVAPNS